MRILVVDDSPDDILLLSRELLRLPDVAGIGTARNGTDAIHFLRTNRVHLVVTDLHMPGMDGFELIRWIREEGPSRLTPIIVFTCSPPDVDIERALAGGANAFFAKPADIGKLRATLEVVVAFWKMGLMPCGQPETRA